MTAVHARRALVRRALGIFALTACVQFAAAAIASADEPSYSDLRRDFRKAYRAAEYKKALDHAEKMLELRKGDVDTMYNIACLHCLMNERAKAYEWLEKAIDAGYRDADHLLADRDLRFIHGEDRFRAIVRKLRDREAADRKSHEDKSPPEKKAADQNQSPSTESDKKPEVPSREEIENHSSKIQELTQALIDAARKNENEKALELSLDALKHAEAIVKAVGKEHARARAALSMTNYNVACMYSRLKKADDAFRHLEKAVELGSFSGQSLDKDIEADSDFDNIRDDARYKPLIQKAQKQAAAGASRAPVTGRLAAEHQAADESAPPKADDKPKRSDKGEDLAPRQRLQRIQELTGKLIEVSNAGKREEALSISQEALKHAEYLKEHYGDDASLEAAINQSLSLTHYNVACMLALLDRKDEAFKHLEKPVELGGFGNDLVTQMENDADLKSLRKDDRYRAILEKARKAGDKSQDSEQKTVEFQWKVTLPPNHDKTKKAPLLVALHHYHGSMEGATQRWSEAAAQIGAILLTPQGTIQLDEASNWYSWGRDIGLVESNILTAVDKIMNEHKVDADKVIIAGFSQGGWAAWGIALRNPDMFRGVIPVCGNVGVITQISAEAKSVFDDTELRDLRAFIMLGEDEKPSVIESNNRAAELLKKQGAKVELVKYRDVAHGFPDDATQEQVRALKFVLGE